MTHPTILYEMALSVHQDMEREAKAARLARQARRPASEKVQPPWLRVSVALGALLVLVGAVLLS